MQSFCVTEGCLAFLPRGKVRGNRGSSMVFRVRWAFLTSDHCIQRKQHVQHNPIQVSRPTSLPTTNGDISAPVSSQIPTPSSWCGRRATGDRGRGTQTEYGVPSLQKTINPADCRILPNYRFMEPTNLIDPGWIQPHLKEEEVHWQFRRDACVFAAHGSLLGEVIAFNQSRLSRMGDCYFTALPKGNMNDPPEWFFTCLMPASESSACCSIDSSGRPIQDLLRLLGEDSPVLDVIHLFLNRQVTRAENMIQRSNLRKQSSGRLKNMDKQTTLKQLPYCTRVPRTSQYT
ncbi:uncharacterized protein BP01DRAFT_410424 [Aspergillus saccharolyticus JOP 1030-1]|uniref:Uncharacterized protein n=1 Tax=Aspergillus saccharolyticus JOP 1030-1 TaxID=1450539 RepID=A0A318ZLB6_9EURO|nr:hypothetical protein BP01DRAFT_410424 [Aspergillus saccharolyticus JOP 1030-1]PYH47545.1 hypothetical protein BP01DRAFT_410424 [Aspergillus saccharolyticus JOP 1030-1]